MIFSPDDYGALGDVIKGADGAISSGSNQFVSGKVLTVGKLISIRGAGIAGQPLFTTVTAVDDDDPTHATLAANASATVSNATWLSGTDDTVAVQAALDLAVDGGSVIGRVRSFYMVSTVHVRPGTEYVRLHLCGTSASPGGASGGIVQIDDGVEECEFRLHIDMSAGYSNDSIFIGSTGVVGDGPKECLFNRCIIEGAFDGGLKYGIFLQNSPEFCTFDNCRFTGSFNPAVRQNLLSLQGNAVAFGGYLPNGAIQRASAPAYRNTVQKCKFTDGSYATILGGAAYNVLNGNTCRGQNHRAFYLGPDAWHNTVVGNDFHDYLSSGVVCGYSSSHNAILANSFRCEFDVYGNTGEASINIQTGSRNNSIIGNQIDAMKNYGVYLGPDVAGNQVISNEIRNYMLSAIHVDADWSSNPVAPSMQRPNYAAPQTVHAGATRWAFAHTSNIAIQGNVIGAPTPTTPYSRTAAISMAQNGTLLNLQHCSISNNTIVDDTALTYYLNIYETMSGKCVNNKLAGNSFDSNLPGKFYLKRGLSHFNTVSGNGIIDDGRVTFANGDTSPDVSVGTLFFCFNSAPTVITAFDGVPDTLTKTIVVRLDKKTTLVHSNTALPGQIRLKGNANVVGNSSNQLMMFACIQGLWFELSRSF